MRISDWSSDVCSSDLLLSTSEYSGKTASSDTGIAAVSLTEEGALSGLPVEMEVKQLANSQVLKSTTLTDGRSEEHTSELQSLMRISYAVFCLKKKKTEQKQITNKEAKVKSHIEHTTEE